MPPATIISERGSSAITQVATSNNVISFQENTEQYMAAKKEAIVTAACAFGNSFTLPLVLLSRTPLHHFIKFGILVLSVQL